MTEKTCDNCGCFVEAGMCDDGEGITVMGPQFDGCSMWRPKEGSREYTVTYTVSYTVLAADKGEAADKAFDLLEKDVAVVADKRCIWGLSDMFGVHVEEG